MARATTRERCVVTPTLRTLRASGVASAARSFSRNSVTLRFAASSTSADSLMTTSDDDGEVEFDDGEQLEAYEDPRPRRSRCKSGHLRPGDVAAEFAAPPGSSAILLPPPSRLTRKPSAPPAVAPADVPSSPSGEDARPRGSEAGRASPRNSPASNPTSTSRSCANRRWRCWTSIDRTPIGSRESSSPSLGAIARSTSI